MRAQIFSETGLLRDVLLASVAHFAVHPPINVVQRHFYAADPPLVERMRREQAALVDALERRGVRVHWATPQPQSPVQFNTRDVATVVGETLVVCAMKEPIRQDEPAALEPLLARLDTPVVRVESGVVEGGDVMLDRETLFVGLSERTDGGGLEWLRQTFGGAFEIVPLRLKRPFLHLDVVFNLVGPGLALVYPPAFEPESAELLDRRYRVIPVSQDEQFALATNLFSISPETVLMDQRHTRVGEALAAAGLEVVPVPYAEMAKVGGSLRCSTCPLVREPL